MSTEAQIAANRSNAQHSTGPRSEAGKAASSQNHTKFGFNGHFMVQPWEKQEEFDALTKKLSAEHRPRTDFEIDLVKKMAEHYWLSRRAILLQETCFDVDHLQCPDFCEKKLALYLRYQTTHERAFERCSNELRKLRNEKVKEIIGFESQERREADELRKQAAEKRKKELHQFAVLLAEAKVEHQKVLVRNAQVPKLVGPAVENTVVKAEIAA